MGSIPLRSAERSRRLLAHGILVVLLILAGIVAYLAMAPRWRAAGVRLGCTCLVVVGCVRARRVVRRLADAHRSDLDAPAPPPLLRELDGAFRRLRDDLLFSVRSRQYFEAILWPRLLDLSGGRLSKPAVDPRRRRRGPSFAELDRLITEAERRA
jgi:hypothetical protein